MRAALPLALLVAVHGLAGCTDLGMAEPTLEVKVARLEAGDCTFGERDEASDPAWCHVLTVTGDNRDGSAPMNTQADKWTATSDPRGDEHLFPRVDGPTDIAPGESATVILGFDAPPDVRLVRLRYLDDVTGATAETTVPDY